MIQYFYLYLSQLNKTNMPRKSYHGEELHRLKVMEDYDPQEFARIYKACTPVINNLSRNIDCKRFNVSRDIIKSYFWDKFLYVFNKYQKIYEEPKLLSTILHSLTTYKNKLLRAAYSDYSEFNQGLKHFEDLFDDSKEDRDLDILGIEDYEMRDERIRLLDEYMKSNLSPDAQLVWECRISMPEFLRERLKKDDGKPTIVDLLDFFGMKRTKGNHNYMSNLRAEVEYWLEKAKENFNKKDR